MNNKKFLEFMHALGFNFQNLPKVGRREMKFGSREDWEKFGKELKNLDKELSEINWRKR